MSAALLRLVRSIATVLACVAAILFAVVVYSEYDSQERMRVVSILGDLKALVFRLEIGLPLGEEGISPPSKVRLWNDGHAHCYQELVKRGRTAPWIIGAVASSDDTDGKVQVATYRCYAIDPEGDTLYVVDDTRPGMIWEGPLTAATLFSAMKPAEEIDAGRWKPWP